MTSDSPMLKIEVPDVFVVPTVPRIAFCQGSRNGSNS